MQSGQSNFFVSKEFFLLLLIIHLVEWLEEIESIWRNGKNRLEFHLKNFSDSLISPLKEIVLVSSIKIIFLQSQA